MNHKEYKDLLALEALDSLDKAEASLLHEHLATCDECCRELIELHDAAALLALSVDEIAPPETLRARILESLKETNTFPHRETNNQTNANSETETSEETGKVLPLRRRNNAGAETAFVSKSALWSGALAASLVAALIISLIVLWQRNNTRQEEQARLSNRNDEKQPELNQSLPRNAENNETNAEIKPSSNDNIEAPTSINRLPNRNLPNRNDNDNRQDKKTEQPKLIAPSINQPQVIESPITEPPVNESTASVTETRVVELSGTAKAPQAHASMVLEKSAGKITVTVSDLPPPAVGRAYQLWFIVKGHPIPGAVFVTGQEGRAMIHGQIPVRAREASTFAITLEESNGANKPTGAKYLLGSITAS